MDRGRDRRAVRRLGLGGAVVALSGIRRNVRVSARGVRAAPARQGPRVSLQLAVPLICSVPAGERLHRLRELRGVSVSAAGRQRRRARRGGGRDRRADAGAALPAHVAGRVGRECTRRRGRADGRARGARRAVARGLRPSPRAGAASALELGVSGGLRERARHHALRLRRLRGCRPARRRGREAAADDPGLDRDLRRAGGDPVRPAAGGRARHGTVALAARFARRAHGAGAVRWRVRRRAHVGTRRGDRGHAARVGYRVRVAVRQPARLLANLVRRGPGRSVSSRIRPVASAQRDSARRAARRRRIVAGREPVHAGSGDRVFNGGNRVDSRHRADRRTRIAAGSARRGTVSHAALSAARRDRAGRMEPRLRGLRGRRNRARRGLARGRRGRVLGGGAPQALVAVRTRLARRARALRGSTRKRGGCGLVLLEHGARRVRPRLSDLHASTAAHSSSTAPRSFTSGFRASAGATPSSRTSGWASTRSTST